ncbi:MAG: CAP domain-containing protein, partial [Dehalococcoidales bacterium]|nr:CAP domain-containing protein [Dehalococcoidales bacterium]
FSIDRYTTWAKSDTWNFTAVQHEYEIYQQDKVVLNPFTQFVTGNSLQLQGVGKITLESAMWYIPPTGLPVQTTDNIYPTIASSTQFTLTIPFDQNGTYLAEINDTNGEAVFNYPFYKAGTFPLLPNPRDKEENFTLVSTINLNQERSKMLVNINAERSKAGLSSLTLQENVNNLAQARSDDMANRNYFSHVTPEGKTAADLAPEYNVTGSDIGENIAKDNNPVLALYGLFRSAAHRNLLLSSDFQSIGIGLSKAKDGQIVVVQIFN